MLCVVVAAGLVGSQLSEFIQQYTQNLAGRRAEAQYEVQGLVARATEAAVPLGAYMSEFTASANPVFVREGEAMQARVDRATALDEAYHEIGHAGLLARPFVFAAHVNADVAADVWRHYRPALPLDSVSVLYCGMLMAVAALAYRVLGLLLAAPLRRALSRRARRNTPVGPIV